MRTVGARRIACISFASWRSTRLSLKSGVKSLAEEPGLKELLHRYAELYHRAPTGFISLNRKGVIVESDQAASEMLGLPRASCEAPGISPSYLLHGPVRNILNF